MSNYKSTMPIPIIYFLVGIVEIIAAMNGWKWTMYLLKPSLMLLLFAWTFMPDLRDLKGKKWLRIGLLAACLGDTFLMFSGYFVQGLGSFLIMQLFYITAFRSDIEKWKLSSYVVVVTLLMAIAMTFLLYSILSVLQDPILRIAVPCYASAIGIMAIIASFRNLSVSKESYWYVLIGAILFVISDSFIAWNAFVEPIKYSTLWVMSTYILAQYSIVKGCLKTS